MFTLSNHAAAIDSACQLQMTSMEEPASTDQSHDPKPRLADLTQNKRGITNVDLLSRGLVDPECEAMLETMESVVGCVEGVDEQHVFEEKLIENALHRKAAVEQHGLTDAEAALIRLHIMEDQRDDSCKQVQLESAIPDLDILNFCGNDDDLDDAQGTFIIPITQEVISCADLIDEELVLRKQKDLEVRDGIVVGQDINALQCAICFDEALTGGSVSLNRVKFANLPCCGNGPESSTASFIKVCTSCILVLTSPSSSGTNRIGRCPRCFVWIKVQLPEPSEKNLVAVAKVDVAGPCLICNQHKDFLVENDNICDSCFLGRRQPLKYECQQCHCIQKIPHPMYRYQKEERKFGNVAWACQGKCGRFTKWKILPEEVHRIPLGDAPKSWGYDYIKLARERVQIFRQDLVGRDSYKGSQGISTLNNEDPSQCLIL